MKSKGAKTRVEKELEGSFFCYSKSQLRTEMTKVYIERYPDRPSISECCCTIKQACEHFPDIGIF
jgi:hypothetical protein